MSKSEILYVRGMSISESDEGLSNEDIWDDTQIIKAYDKAMKTANVEVAKRIAMSTNNRPKGKTSQSKSKSSKKEQWTAGAACRAMYEGDGLEYEAFVLRLIDDKECVVRFLGYDNSEIVALSSLKPSYGSEAQQLQIENALLDKDSETDSNTASGRNHRITSPGSTVASERSVQRKNKSKRKKTEPKPTIINGFELPNMLPMPNIGTLKNLGSMDIPMPPPPLPFPTERMDCEDQAVSSMLLSWYMSGYYTGLYQGLKRSKQDKKHKD